MIEQPDGNNIYYIAKKNCMLRLGLQHHCFANTSYPTVSKELTKCMAAMFTGYVIL